MGPQTVARWLLLEIPPSDHDPSQQGSTHPKIQEIGLSSKDCLVISSAFSKWVGALLPWILPK